jgi:uncharacterized protein (DUF608 family)
MPPNLDRRKFLKLTGASVFLPAFGPGSRLFGSPPEVLYKKVIPWRKNLDPEWATSLAKQDATLRAPIRSSSKDELRHIGMTVGGIGCGTVYLSGDGRLYVWDIFHRPHEGVVAQRLKEIPKGLDVLGGHQKIVRERDGSNYIKPPTPDTFPNPFRQEFLLEVEGHGEARSMDAKGWSEIAFTGQWPLGTIDYNEPDYPIRAQLNAWTPFIPLQTEDSSLPVTVMEYTLTNTGKQTVKGSFTGIWENPVLIYSRQKQEHDVSSIVERESGVTLIRHQPASSQPMPEVTDWGTVALATLSESTPTAKKDGLVCEYKLKPGESRTFTFLLTWHFPNLQKLHKPLGPKTPYYTTRFEDASEAALYIASCFRELREGTMKWVHTWNDSTLPQWLLDRSILTTNTLQTTTSQILGGKEYPEGRFWAWEGIGCCPGTCGHVWHYAQGVARLFPSLERNLREVTDYGIAMNEDGSVRFRAECSKAVAIDSQAGVILRTWREHLVSVDSAFLGRVWPEARKALEWLVEFDRNDADGLDGLLDGKQHNTLDADWYGKVHCLCSLYLAALAAGREMALVKNDEAFAKQCATVLQKGGKKISTLFNGEFYEQVEDPAHAEAIGVGKGCYIDQVIGQWWAHQTGLGRIYNEEHIRSALHSLWKYNFVPHVGTFRQSFNQGRFYALDDEAGLVMCTWPKGGLRDDFKKHWQYGYFNECMTGFEWQVAAHMIQEGEIIEDADFEKAGELLETDSRKALTLRGLAIGRAIHDRYHPAKRNPYNEIECSDHYARAGASYSAFLALCGFEYNGPAARIGFAPKLNPSNFKAAFTAAEGWGTFSQKHSDGKWKAEIELAHGSLKLQEIQLPWLALGARITRNNRSVSSNLKNGSMTTDKPVLMRAGDVLRISG